MFERLVKKFLLPMLFLIVTFSVGATHLKGGWIGIESIVGKTVNFRIYFLISSNHEVSSLEGTFDFGVGEVLTKKFTINKLTEKEGYLIGYFDVSNTYPGNGNYTATFSTNGREPIANANIVDPSFYHFQTSFVIDPFLQNTPPRIDGLSLLDAKVHRPFHRSVITKEEDGDILIFKMQVPKDAGRIGLPEYQLAGLSIDRISGNLKWNIDQVVTNQSSNLHGYAVSVQEVRFQDDEPFILSETIIDFVFTPDFAFENEFSVSTIDDLCDQDEFSVRLEKGENVSLSVDLPFLDLKKGEPSSVLNESVVNSDTTFEFEGNDFQGDFSLGSIRFETESSFYSYNIAFYKDCATIGRLNSIVTGLSKEELEVTLSPNPSKGSFALNMNDKEPYIMKILTMNGQEIYVSEIRDGYQSLDLTNRLSNGVYLIQISDRFNRLMRVERLLITN
jgi:hypothetical protein